MDTTREPARRRGPLRPGEPVVFIDRRDRIYYEALREGGTTNVRGNLIRHDDVLGQADGVTVLAVGKSRYRVFRATAHDHALYMPRHAQIVYPKDAAMMVAYGDVYPGARVVEAGLGSGALSASILRAIGAEGSLTTYELREEPSHRARKNIEALLGPITNHTVTIGDIYDGIVEREVDRILLDVPEPWEVLDHAADALVDGGIFVVYVPTALQLHRFGLSAKRSDAFVCFEAFETMLRSWYVGTTSVRPKSQMVGHTGFICVTRRVARGSTPFTRRPERSQAVAAHATEGAEPAEDDGASG